MKLPPNEENKVPINERNIFKVLINSRNEILIENRPFESFAKLKDEIKEFVLNNGKISNLSDDPEKAIVSLRVDRGRIIQCQKRRWSAG